MTGSGNEVTMNVWRGDATGGEFREYHVASEEGMVVLDVVHRLQYSLIADPTTPQAQLKHHPFGLREIRRHPFPVSRSMHARGHVKFDIDFTTACSQFSKRAEPLSHEVRLLFICHSGYQCLGRFKDALTLR